MIIFFIKKMASLKYQLLFYVILLGTSVFTGPAIKDVHTIEVPRHSLYQLHLLISSTRSPLVKDHDLAVINFGIIEKIVLDILANHLGFTYDIVPPRDIMSTGFLQRNGSWTGTTGQLQRREVDMCVTMSVASSNKAKILDVSYPVVYADSAILIAFPTEKSKIWSETSSFEAPAWIAILVTFIAIVLVSWIILRVNTGLIQYAERTAKSQNRCRVSDLANAQAHKIAPLGRKEMGGSLVILALGMAISLFIFLVELSVAKMRKAFARK
ncbi:hypothetical protein GHT06_015622 [Daphnia sinensis]|uniref:Ionotropic glutamate receptor L-glutamate and glycine-binding domain-containing protein n=1 Tax=Daphnia sinensis TaxID=1820382 RepID=A0AAD5LAU1_9CRUS|nr:hypothetical protein GHT06_015622 [Daphnia sinensis]